MAVNPTYEELEQRVKELERAAIRRQEAEEALGKSEERFRRIAEAITDYIYTVSIQKGRPVETIHGLGCVGVTGYMAEDFREKTNLWIEMVHEEDRKRVEEQAAQILSGVKVPALEHRIIRKDGAIRWVRNTPVLNYDVQGKLLSYDALIQDITERKQAEEALRASEERFRMVADFAYDWEYWVDPDGNYVYVSPSCERITGFGVTDFFKDSTLLEMITHPRDQQMILRHVQEELESHEPLHLDFRIITASGQERWISHYCQPVYSADRCLGRRASNRDITLRRQAEEALRESEEKFRLIFENALNAIFWASPETGLITNCNKAAESLLEKGRDEIVGQHQTRLHPPQKAQYFSDMFRRHIEEKGSIDDEAEIITKSGRIVPVHITASVITVGGRQIVQGIFQDITERRRAEEALQESERKYSTLAESSLTGIYIDQDGRIAFANNRFAEIYRYPKDEAVGIESWKVVHPEDRDMTNAIRAKRLTGEDAPSEYEARGLTKDGETIWIKRRNRRIEYKGRPAILGNIVDVTEQKRAEEELRKINTELNNFVDVVSHDLKNPIIVIHGLASKVLKSYQDTLDERACGYLAQIRASTLRMEALIRDLLALSRIGRVVSTFHNVSSLQIVTKVVSDLEDRLKEKCVELSVADDLPTICCDPERMYQVFENLLVNGIKFTGTADRPVIEIGCRDRGDSHQFYVRDNGIGIDPKHHRRIFEMFHRVQDIEDKDGTGLGLAIVDRIVNNHGGKVWVESEKGKGAIFYFALPKWQPSHVGGA
ncbi:MAG: PAS domain S-box protein [Deltaproteobacteria bacterium]